ncbi:DUF1810 domain-containing protein [Telluribacter sp. SYSU D00476]|uniref:DUF1810 domain-containing protein n=1 Tax=Telluribacter sp. SYSU D00476 TaxID=2811430 RepID=UPI001FF5D5DE|nr:DUF1810 domain-containing protein [Telluribacter sp. SYSU D00476]
MTDTYDLNRFLEAQENVYHDALREIRNGRKQSHWMWFIFPQILGLGQTETSRYYAIKSSGEAAAYLSHPVLGSRLREISEALLSVRNKSALDIMGTPDDLKLRSSMTLFGQVSNDNRVFEQVLDCYFNGEKDGRTIQILREMGDEQL